MSIQLTKVQFFLLLFIMQTAFMYLSFTNLLITHGKRDATLQFLVIAFLYLLVMLFYERNFRYFALNGVLKILYLVYWTFYLSIFVAYITYILKSWVFPSTPNTVIIIIFLGICLYASISRPETAVNIGVFLIPMLVLFIVFLFRAIPDLEISNLFPLLYEPKNNWLKGFLFATYAFSGMEMYVMLRKYVMEQQAMKSKFIIRYWGILTGFYFISILFTMMYFALDEFPIIPEPTLYILNSQEVTFVKRVDIFFSHIWLSWTMVSIINYVLVMRLLHFEKKRKSMKLQTAVFFFVIGLGAIFMINIDIMEYIKKHLYIVNFLFGLLIPISIILVNKLRGRSTSDSVSS